MADAEEIRGTADDILSRPEYQPAPRSLLDRGYEWISGKIGDLLASLVGGGGNFFIGWIVLAVMGALLAYFLIKVMPRWRRAKVAETDVELVAETKARAGQDEWLVQAKAAEAAGNWPEAVRARYRALVAGLIDREEVVDFDGATSGEYRQSFQQESNRVEPFGSATERFEEVWYGGDPADATDAGRIRELADQVLGD